MNKTTFLTQIELFLLHIGLDTVGDVLLDVVEEEAVVVEVVALGTEQGSAVSVSAGSC